MTDQKKRRHHLTFNQVWTKRKFCISSSWLHFKIVKPIYRQKFTPYTTNHIGYGLLKNAFSLATQGAKKATYCQNVLITTINKFLKQNINQNFVRRLLYSRFLSFCSLLTEVLVKEEPYIYLVKMNKNGTGFDKRE